MEDVQSKKSTYPLCIDRVGIKGLILPIKVAIKKDHPQNTIAKISMYVDLPEKYKGTHMSRFLEIIYRHRGMPVSYPESERIVNDMAEKFKTKIAQLEIEFPYFIEKYAPVTQKKSILDYNCRLTCIKDKKHKTITVSVNVPITTLCPCSKAISRFGAHNQRGFVMLEAKLNGQVWIEDLINIAEESASCEIYPLLKRQDEAYVTEKAYANPQFVEDVVRNIAFRLKKDRRIKGFMVECESFESIHNHNTYACIKNAYD